MGEHTRGLRRIMLLFRDLGYSCARRGPSSARPECPRPEHPSQFLAAESRYGFLDAHRTMVWRNADPEGVITTRINSEAALRPRGVIGSV